MYYDFISKSYDELYGKEQLKKWELIQSNYNFRGKKVLDVGCGTGIITKEISKITEVIGIDSSKEMVKLAKKKGINCILGDALNLKFNDKSFDVVISTTVMQDIKRENWKKFLSEIRRVTKDSAIISILKRNRKIDELKKFFSNYFEISKVIEDEKDYIFFLRRW